MSLPVSLQPRPFRTISTRAQVLTAGNVLIGGFIIGGTGTKSILVRGLGPTLGDLGVTGFLADPTLDLRNSNQTQIATNDNWKDTQQAEIEATGKPPPHDSEPAILQTSLAPAKYTAILTGKNNTTGIGLVEVYDQSPASTAQLTNISSRGMVATNSNVMIGGFITGVAGKPGDRARAWTDSDTVRGHRRFDGSSARPV